MKICLGAFAILAASILPVSAADPARSARQPDSEIHFNRDIRPILSDRCFACHGPDKAARKGKFRLDIREDAVAKAIVPGHAAKSSLIARILSNDPDEMMPPPDSQKPRLTSAEVDLLRRWIDAGATWELHWAYLKPVRPALPAAVWGELVETPVDVFVQTRLAKENLRPAAQADPRTLIRRLSFDLIGLPPTPAEVKEFSEDQDPEAYEHLVDRLLASPHFGERLALNWLDWVRYADTDGFHADNYRSVYPYRDYVIDAFNQNMPFDRFTIEQIAGDLLPNLTTAQKIASTYNRLHRTTEEGGAQPKEYLAKYAADRVRTTSTVWLASTMGCSECHDHKFDPFTTRDFYSFEAFFADLKEKGVGKPDEYPVPNEKQAAVLDRFDSKVAALEQQLETSTPELELAQSRWENHLQAEFTEGRLQWAPLRPEKASAKNGAMLVEQDDLSLLAKGENPDNDNYEIQFRTNRTHVTGLRLEALTDPSFDKKSLSRGGGNFVLTEIEAELSAEADAKPARVSFASALADFSQNNFPVSAAIDGKPDTGWGVDGQNRVENRKAAFIFAKPIDLTPNSTLTVRLKHESKFKKHQIGRFRLSLISVDRPTLDEHGLPDPVSRTLQKIAADRKPDETASLAKYFRSNAPELQPVRDQLAAKKKERDDFLKTVPRSLVTVTVEPRPIRILPRGNWMNDSGEIVQPMPPKFLTSADSAGRRLSRLDLARWLVSRDNPLTARVFVNRLWRKFFGTGLSKTLDDFGAQGEWPTHPELLDWLAVEFMDSGWDIKHVIKLIVMSHTYRQSSLADDNSSAKDPYNRLLAHQGRFRLPAEVVRDNALAVSGMLSEKIGGPSVKPYQPAGYWANLNFPKREYQNDRGENEYRRGLYSFWCRTFTHPSLMAFDAPSREECVIERAVSNTPMQALALLNDPTYVEAARVFAEKALRCGGTTAAERIHWSFQQALERDPSNYEKEKLSALCRKETERYKGDLEAAKQLIAVGEMPVPKDLNPAELAAWTSVARVIFNLNETIVRY